jgi:hypothetical protein
MNCRVPDEKTAVDAGETETHIAGGAKGASTMKPREANFVLSA